MRNCSCVILKNVEHETWAAAGVEGRTPICWVKCKANATFKVHKLILNLPLSAKTNLKVAFNMSSTSLNCQVVMISLTIIRMSKFENKFFFSNTLTYTILLLLVGRMEYLSI